MSHEGGQSGTGLPLSTTSATTIVTDSTAVSVLHYSLCLTCTCQYVIVDISSRAMNSVSTALHFEMLKGPKSHI